jgi:hypothetical protein
MQFLIDRYRGKIFSEATGYDDEKIQTKVKEGEASVEKFKSNLVGGCKCFGYIG